jgi:hypothetical protein
MWLTKNRFATVDFALSMTLLFGLLINTRIPLAFLEKGFVIGRTYSENAAAVHDTPPRGIEATLRKR